MVTRERHDWADATRGLTIFAVVVVHVFISLWDAGLTTNRLYFLSIIYLRTIVIPIFLFLSGMFAGRRFTVGSKRFFQDWSLRIVWPYLFWGAVIIAAEYAFRGVRNPIDTSPTNFTLLWTPIAWLWFLYVLAIFQVLTFIINGRSRTLIIISVLGLVVDALFALPILVHLCCLYLFVYGIGVVFGPVLKDRRIADRLGIPALIASVPLVLMAVPNIAQIWSPMGLPGACAGVVGVCWLGQRFKTSRALLYLGRRSMGIYLVHIFFIAAIRVVLVKIAGITDVTLLSTACLVAGFAGSAAVWEIAYRCGITTLIGFGFAPVRSNVTSIPAGIGFHTRAPILRALAATLPEPVTR